MKTEKRTTGNAALDALLGGGLELRTITQFYGEPASGKSTLCLVAAIACLRAGHVVAWIDSEGFSTERFRQIAGEDTEKIAERFFLFEPVDFEHQGSMILEVEKVLKAHKPGLLAIDSATALYRTDLEKGRDAMQALTRQMIHLLGYAKRYEIPVIITNQVYMDTIKNTFYGLGGTALEHISKVIVRLEKTDKPGLRRARLVKHRSRPEGASFEYEITGDGISVR
ncbi:DNA repair and recombination protein RadB [Methanoregula formicica]|uniref:DNA repair and recombination protein RadB n=1 Tax=Methanoregula formicica (strain DSM 22288 / NBRC 105244 / SMSP) TaxID=593750 RepID=L0HDA8_METFS|nr:DNA repair and recombination protein RadB [Methanoregula formicica]AGB01303.1 DNA repair and recombination protein RadB [Methanoregula formicica SMSP]